jgi:hypothetical protein
MGKSGIERRRKQVVQGEGERKRQRKQGKQGKRGRFEFGVSRPALEGLSLEVERCRCALGR